MAHHRFLDTSTWLPSTGSGPEFIEGNTDFRLFHHRITLSALAKTLGGIVNPICLAALRLITSSNFVGCSTGISAGLAPFRILSTWVAARRNRSSMLTP